MQFGDEGKAKVIDLIADRYDIVARFNGGANAGHTVSVGGETIALKQLPSAIFHESCLLYIGSGCVLNVPQICKEISAVEKLGIDLRGRLRISGRANIVQPHHIAQDKSTGSLVGTTGNGIGPAYADRVLRADGPQVLPILFSEFCAEPANSIDRARKRLESARDKFNDADLALAETYLSDLEACAGMLDGFLSTDELYLVNRVRNGARVLFEGAQSFELDVIHGDIPFVTSSNTVPGSAYVGGDLPVSFHRYTIGVAKALMSRVGNGPFPSEFGGNFAADYCEQASANGEGKGYEAATFDPPSLLESGKPFETGVALRMLSDEYGTGTGRPRRIGMLDMVQLENAVAFNGIDLLYVNKCDFMSVFLQTPSRKIPVVQSYGDPAGTDLEIRHFDCFEELESIPNEKEMLPQPLVEFLNYIEACTNAKLLGIGLSPERSENLLFGDLLNV